LPVELGREVGVVVAPSGHGLPGNTHHLSRLLVSPALYQHMMAFSCSTDSRELLGPCDVSLYSVTVIGLVPPDGYLGPLGRLLLGRGSHLVALDMCWPVTIEGVSRLMPSPLPHMLTGRLTSKAHPGARPALAL
jgi:hypothetical protein